MKLMSIPHLFHLLLFCATQTLGVRIQSDSVVGSEGVIQIELEGTVSLLCLSDGDSEPDEGLVWLRNGAMVRLMEENKKNGSRVCVTPAIQEDNGATFTCHLSSNASDSDSVTLNVTYPPPIMGSEELVVEEESVLVLQCDILANPQVSSVVWTVNGSTVDLLAGGFTLTDDGVTSQLIANSVDKSLHAASYGCLANSPLYGEFNKTFQVTVTDKVMKFPLMPIIAGVVVVCLTAILAVISRWSKIRQCCK
ncbi:transmembrane and immunoglobulin domain-containing protein 1 [Pleuronectes platessa]|uniref:transmembrane and immunoglobulin domain-containing protein 1 n=1 Tax=Pleuronectes platessa TaxID=8262 RepID=UPI00232A78DE|nr:transmembrane and immunoglobulin domain-containing protein 1 [Pleuronectes platessa]XP_053297497.1 transmembrane and immunoglobulin domain-containing protein 1 [Pleuronectes platessa]